MEMTRDASKVSWVPATPVKPHQDPSCTYQHRNKKDQTSNFVQEQFCQENEPCQASTMSPLLYGTGFHKSDGRTSLKKPMEETTESGPEKPSVQISENSGYNVFSMESVDKTIPFCHLLALANAAASGSNSFIGSTPVAQTEDKGAKEGHEENNPPTSELVVENSNYVTGLTESTGKNTTPQQKPRRKKYMPKVMREGQPKRTPRPKTPILKTPRPANPNDDQTAKRKDVGRKGINMTPNTPIVDLTQTNTNIYQETLSVDLSDITRNIHPDTPSVNSKSKSVCRSRRSCRRTLNFDTEYQVREVTSSCSHVSEYDWDSGAWGWKRTVDDGQVEQIADVQSESTRGKCCTVVSDVTNDKESEIVQIIDLNSHPVPRSPNASNCSTTIPFTWGEQAKRKRGHSSAAGEYLSSTNIIGAHHNSVQAYQALFPVDQCCSYGIPHMYFPAIYKKKRTEKCQKSVTSIMEQTTEYSPKGNGGCAFTSNSYQLSSASQCNVTNPPTKISSAMVAQDKPLSFRCMLATGSKDTRKKRSKSATRVRDIASLIEIVESLQSKRSCIIQEIGSSHKPETHEAKTKKRTKRNTLASGTVKKDMFSVDMLVEHLRHLDINAEKQQVADPNMSAISSYSTLYQEQNALVVYQRDGTLVPIKKRTRRPRVNLDEETIRVWNLLLQDINSEGINGTDEDKEKWWEEERRLFRERAMSFIDRMHLIQGDRRFSRWKGSVVDSVVGVFLTQNVSDHLSSSAFMAVAARFPPNLKSSHSEVEGSFSLTRPVNTEVCVRDPNDTFVWQGMKSEQPSLDQRPIVIEDVTSNESTVSSSVGRDRPKYVSSCNLLDTAGRSFVELLRIAETTKYIGEVTRFSGIHKEGTEILSCEEIGSSRETASQATVQQIVTMDSHEASNASIENYLPHCSFQAESDIVCQPPATFEDLKYRVEFSNQEKIDQVECVNSEKIPGTLDVTGGTSDFNDSRMNGQKEAESSLSNHDALSHTTPVDKVPQAKRGRKGKGKQTAVYWDSLRKKAQINGERERTPNTMDSVDWEAVRCADVEEVAHTIRERGMNNMLAERIKEFLDRLVSDHGSIDLEWLRDVPPDQAKEYLLSFRGLGLKSVECVRLLTLHHVAFPVDTNVGRIAVRLGWVPLQPLPESLQLHLLELYPVLESIQKYLWPRLCKLDQRTLYELHYQMITFGKVFCTKSKPNCNACPMRGECRHFASAFASARLALPAPEEKNVAASKYITANQNPVGTSNRLPEPVSLSHQLLEANSHISDCEPVIEVPTSPEPIIEVPATPEPEIEQVLEDDIEDFYHEDPKEIPTIKLNIEEFTQTLQEYMQRNMELQEGDVSKALVALTPEAASIPAVKLKNVNQLRTEHQVYELPDTHPLLDGFDRREPDDPCKYLLAIWTPGETADSIQPPGGPCIYEESGGLCSDGTCFECSSTREAQSQTVRGTLLIPCRTAMRGSFPLNGTYFQVNEVFADHESSLNPIDVPRSWLWKLPRKTVFFGTSIPSIFKGLTTEGIQFCFWKGFVCVRGFDRQTRAPRPLIARLHFPASKLARGKGKRETQ